MSAPAPDTRDLTPAERRAAERRAAFVAGCQRVGPKVYRAPVLVSGPRGRAAFLSSALPVVEPLSDSIPGGTFGPSDFSFVYYPDGKLSHLGFRAFSVGFRPNGILVKDPT